MKNDQLLDQLVQEHSIVSPIASLQSSVVKTLVVTAVYLALVIYAMGFRDDIRYAINSLFFNLEGVVLLLASVLGVVMSHVSVRPGMAELPRYRFFPKLLLGLCTFLVLSWITRFSGASSSVVFNLNYGRARVLEVVLTTGIPLTWLIFQMKKGLVSDPKLTLFSVSFTMGALSTLCLHLGCCPIHPAQVLVWHFIPAVILAGAVTLLWWRVKK